jgi:outer membrane protein TolC
LLRVNGFVRVAAIVALAPIAAAQSLTLRAAVDEALSSNPAMTASDAQRRTAEAREREARAARFPRFAVTESATRGNNPVFVFGSLLEQGRFAASHFDPSFLNAPDAMTNYRAAATAQFVVFDGFRTTAAIRQSANGAERARTQHDEATQRLRARVITAFYGVLVAEERLGVARDAAKTAEADAKATRDRFDQGPVVESEALAADVQLAAFRQRVIAAEGELAIARASLLTLLHRSQSDAVTIDGTLPAALSQARALDDAIDRAIAQRAPIKIATSNSLDAQLRLSATRGTALPRVDAFGTFGASGGTFGNRDSDHTAGVVVTLDLFDPGRAARVAAARGEIDAARAGEAMARDAVTLEVITAWHRMRTADAMTATAEAAVGQAESAARIVRDRYSAGVATITEHLRAQTALIGVRFDLLAARYERLAARAELLRATGDLTDVDPFL